MENLDELESHLRDSVTVLQSKGLSDDEAFLIGTRRIGNEAVLEPEFARENGGRGWRHTIRRFAYLHVNQAIHGLVLLYFTAGCWLLWGTLRITLRVAQMLNHGLHNPSAPGFTQLFLSLMPYWYVPPVAAVLYCGFVWTRKGRGNAWFGFFAFTTAALLLMALPTLIAAALPVVDLLNRLPKTAWH
jgi:hypothetical protein